MSAPPEPRFKGPMNVGANFGAYAEAALQLAERQEKETLAHNRKVELLLSEIRDRLNLRPEPT